LDSISNGSNYKKVYDLVWEWYWTTQILKMTLIWRHFFYLIFYLTDKIQKQNWKTW
jgi:hypothetical protein